MLTAMCYTSEQLESEHVHADGDVFHIQNSWNQEHAYAEGDALVSRNSLNVLYRAGHGDRFTIHS